MADRPYVRVYHADLIRDYPDVWDDDHLVAAWLRLLVAADGGWPAPAELPGHVRRASLTALVDAGLLTIVHGHRYTIKGLDVERGARQDAARNAAASRWGNADRNAPASDRAMRPPMPNRADPSKAEPSSTRDPDDPWDAPETEALAWLAKHGCAITPGNGYHRNLVTLVEVHGVNAVVGMFDRLALAGTKQGDTKGFVFGAKDALDAQTRPSLAVLEKEDRADDAARVRANRVTATILLAHDNGYHAEPDPRCERCVPVKELTR